MPDVHNRFPPILNRLNYRLYLLAELLQEKLIQLTSGGHDSSGKLAFFQLIFCWQKLSCLNGLPFDEQIFMADIDVVSPLFNRLLNYLTITLNFVRKIFKPRLYVLTLIPYLFKYWKLLWVNI